MENNKDIKAHRIGLMHLHSKDKINALDILKQELIDADLINCEEFNEDTVFALKNACMAIEDAIVDAIKFARRTEINDIRKWILVESAKELFELKSKQEKLLENKGYPRTKSEVLELRAAFDFELKPEGAKKDLPNADEIESKLKQQIGVDFLSIFTGKDKASEIPKTKAGRPKVEIKQAKDYFVEDKFCGEAHIIRFIEKLKADYGDVKPSVFNELIMVLKHKCYLIPATNKEIKESFEEALNRKVQAQQNFNKQFSKDPKDLKDYKNIEERITLIRELSLTE